MTSNAEIEKKIDTFKKKQVIVFKLGQEEYGLMIDQIKEVVLTPNITKVPLTSNFIKGVANIRGNILTIIDLEIRLGLIEIAETSEQTNSNYTLVVENEDFKVGILVKEVPNTLAISESDIDQSPNVIHDQHLEKNYINGIIKLQNRLIILIDINKIIAKEEISNTI
ncbi:MAG: purine-binding chemotaxis protein CheW [Cytophagales bacterium]|nr:MAG: purine-binding chemotaxis protein CheW [Cytophagales bacterium]